MSEQKIPNENIYSVDSIKKSTGEATYLEDIKISNLLTGRILRSPVPHAKILNIDTRKAEKLPGVKAVVTGADIPDCKYGFGIEDQLIFAKDKVRYIGDEIAAVAAINEEAAEEALSLIKVEFAELKGLYTPEVALAENSCLVHEEFEANIAHRVKINRGDIDKAFKDSSVILEDEFITSRVHPTYMETQGCIALTDISGRTKIYTPTQTPGMTKMKIAGALQIPINKIDVVQTYVGGGFGGKVWAQIWPITALLSRKTDLPVRINLERKEDFNTTYPRVPMKINIKMGADSSGYVLAKEMNIISDNGAYSLLSPAIVDTAATRVDSLYRFKNLRTEGLLIYTNTTPTGMFRGFGNPQATFAVESMMEMMAEELNMEPLEFRMKNATQKGDLTAHGWEIVSCELKECLKKSAKMINYHTKKDKKSEDKKLRGVGMSSCIHVSGNRGVFPAYDGSNAEIVLKLGGEIEVIPSAGDIGQGANTMYAQVASQVLDLPLANIVVKKADTEITGFGLGAYASRVTMMAGNAVKNAAINLKKKILTEVANLYQLPLEKIDLKEGSVIYNNEKVGSLEEIASKIIYNSQGASIRCSGCFNPPNVTIPDKKDKYGNISPSYSFATHMAEVEVDPETGQVDVINYAAVHDAGNIINKLSAEGQVEGGVVTGIGFGLYENMQINKKGELINNSFRDYKIPVSNNIPEIKVAFIEQEDPVGPFGAKSLGEPTVVPVIAALGNALYNATGVRFHKVPFRAEDVRKALEGKN